MKNYLLVRWRNRWQFLFVSAAGAMICLAFSHATNDSKPEHCILFFIGFAAIAILFPFRWRGEKWDEDRRGTMSETAVKR
jgi:uncharacterized membrane protein YfcA